MKKTLIAVLSIVMLVCGLGFAEDFLPPRRLTFVGQTGSWTNETGDRMAISAVIVHGVFLAGTNSQITVDNGVGHAWILVNKDVTNSLAWLDGQESAALEKDGVIAWTMSCSATATNWCTLLFK